MDLNEVLSKLSKKSKVSIEDLKQEYGELLEKENTANPSLSEDDKKTKALRSLVITYKRIMKSNSVVFQGIIIGKTSPINVMAGMIRRAEQAYKDNPQETIMKGVTNDDGVPLDTRKEFGTGRANPGFGRPLPRERWLRNIMGICSIKGSDEAKKFSLVLNDEIAKQAIPDMIPVEFRAINRTEEGASSFKLNGSKLTRFKQIELELPTPDKILEKYFSDSMVSITDLGAYHKSNVDESGRRKDFNKIAIVKGDVTSLNLTPNATTGNRTMVIDSEDNLMDLDSQGILCWVPEDVNVDFAEQSKIIVVGSTGEMPRRNEDGSRSETEKDITMNVLGVYCLPEYKIVPDDIEEVTEEDVSNKETKKEGSEPSPWN